MGGLAPATEAGPAHSSSGFPTLLSGITSPAHHLHCRTNEFAQVGNGTLETPEFTAPRLVAGGHKFRQLSVGGNHACGLVDDGEQPGLAAYCWGNNMNGQLGCSDCEASRGGGSPVPQRVEGYRFEQIEAAIYYTCGVSSLCAVLACCAIAVQKVVLFAAAAGMKLGSLPPPYPLQVAVGGQALCWGQGYTGDTILGRGPLQPRNDAFNTFSLPFPVWGNHTFKSVAGGRDTAVGLLATRAAPTGNSSVPAQPPAAAPAPEATAEVPAPASNPLPTSSSSVPAGAIAGATVGAGDWGGPRQRQQVVSPGQLRCQPCHVPPTYA